MENLVQIIGLTSAALTTLAFVPQVVKAAKTKSTADLSPLMFSLFFIGIAGWLIYGLLIHDLPIILANLVTIFLAGIILFYIIRGDQSTAIHHTGIFVEDLELMKSFYCRNFKGTAGPLYKNDQKGFTSYFISFSGRTSIELMKQQGRKFQSSGQQHIAISLGSKKSVDLLTGHFQKSGLIILDKPRTTGDGYYESKILDPEGNHLELTV